MDGMNRAAAQRAAAERSLPVVLFSEDTAAGDVRGAPMLGDYIPYGWRPALLSDYADVLGSESVVSQRACATRYRGDVIMWCANVYPVAERGEYDRESLARDARNLCRRAAERRVAIGAAIVEAGQFQVYVRFYEKPYRFYEKPYNR